MKYYTTDDLEISCIYSQFSSDDVIMDADIFATKKIEDVQKVLSDFKCEPFRLYISIDVNKSGENYYKNYIYKYVDADGFLYMIRYTDRCNTMYPQANGVTTITITHNNISILDTDIYNALKNLEPYKVEPKNKLHLVSSSNRGLYLKEFNFNPDIDVDFNANYNDDFLPIHELIQDRIKNTNKGIIMLHGEPGTGKSSYIKWILKNATKKVIFLPSNLTSELANPSFVDFVSEECVDSLLVIEDAEDILSSRSSGVNNAVSNILNLSDGLLSDVFNIQLLTTFNCQISEIDSALRRKGRIIAEYEFGKLSADKAQKLSNKLGYETAISQPMTLADIYNQDEQSFTKEKKRIGFG